jgi:hypothetical protein
MNDYMIVALANQRHSDLLAEAERERLGRRVTKRRMKARQNTTDRLRPIVALLRRNGQSGWSSRRAADCGGATSAANSA